MKISNDLKSYLESKEFKQALENNDFEKIYDSIGQRYTWDLTELFYSFGIDPLEFMDKIPNYYSYNRDIETFIVPDNITSIGFGAFYECSRLKSITIQNSVTSIGIGAFYNCNGLTSIIYKGTKAQWNAISKDHGWDSYTGEYIIHCVDGDIQKR